MMRILPGENSKKRLFFATSLITCNKDVLKTITAGSFKVGQLIKDSKVDYLVKFKDFLLSYCPLQI